MKFVFSGCGARVVVEYAWRPLERQFLRFLGGMTLEWFSNTLGGHLSVGFPLQFTGWTIAAIFDQPAPIGKLKTAR